MPTTVLKAEELTDGGIGILTLMVRCGLSPSNGEARRLVQQGGVSVNDTKVTDPKSVIYPEAETILRKGKRYSTRWLWRTKTHLQQKIQGRSVVAGRSFYSRKSTQKYK